MNAQAMAPDGAGGGASRPIALSCRCVRHTGSTLGTHSRVRCPWPRTGAVCARMRRGGSLCSRVTWLLGRGDNNLMQRYTDPWAPHFGCTLQAARLGFVSFIFAPRRAAAGSSSRFHDRTLARSAFRLSLPYAINYKIACGSLTPGGAVIAK